MLLKSLASLGKTFVEVMQIRIDILSLDLREYRIRFVSIMMLGAFAFLCLSLGAVIGSLWFVQSFREENRFLVMGILTAGLLAAGLVLVFLLVFRLFRDPNPLHGSSSELAKDREALGSYEPGSKR